MRKIRYLVAASLDGYIAGPHGEADWITTDPEVDFPAIWAQFDTLLMGRRTYDAARQRLGEKSFTGVSSIVFSRTMRQEDHPQVTVVSILNPDWVQGLKSRPGKDIWLMGGGELFCAFLDGGYVDTVEVNVVPVLLGSGLALLPSRYHPTRLKLINHRIYGSGRVSLEYEVAK